MKVVTIKSKIVGRGGASAATSPGKGVSVDMSGYLLKQIWEKAFEIRVTETGEEYLFGKLNFATQYGIKMYADGGLLDLPSIFDGLPIDNDTIYWEEIKDEEGNVIGKRIKARGGGKGGRIGYVILDKDKSFTEQVAYENTIYEIRDSFTLDDSVAMPDNCILFFNGGSISNGGLELNKTLLSGYIKIDSTCICTGFCINPTLNVKWFGAKGDGYTDDANVIRSVIKLAYTSSYTQNSGYRDTGVVYFPQGEYVTYSSLIDGNMGITYFPVNFKGEGYRSSKIICRGGMLFDNNNVFGYSTFTDLAFDGYNNGSTFMLITAGGVTHGIEFENCLFMSFRTIIESNGNIMGSEITFNNSKISWCGSESSMAVLFILNDTQGVNWRFYATDIDTIYGTVFQYKSGANVNFFQGSIILMGNGSKFIETLPTSIQTSFGDSNAPHMTMYSSRFELRGRSYFMYQDGEGSMYTICFRALFVGVGMGGYNLSKDADFYPMRLIGVPKLTFYNCHNIINYKLWYRNFGYWNADGYIDCINCGDLHYYLYSNINSSLENVNLKANGLSLLKNSTHKVLMDGTGSLVRSFSADSGKTHIETTEVMSFSAWDNVFASSIPTGGVLTKEFSRTMFVSKITYYNYGTPGYGGNTLNISVYAKNEDGSKGVHLCTMSAIPIATASVYEEKIPMVGSRGIVVDISHSYAGGNATVNGALSVSYF